MLVQFLNAQSELRQHLMVTLFFLIFIVYSLHPNFNISIWLLLPLILASIGGIYWLLRLQMKNRLIVAVQSIEKANRFSVVKRKIAWVLIPFLLYSILTLVHFYIVYTGSGEVVPLAYDYGLGGLLALGFNFFLYKKWQFGICNEGIIIGSKLDAKLITWECVKGVDYQSNKIIILLKNGISIQQLEITNLKQIKVFEKLLKYKIS